MDIYGKINGKIKEICGGRANIVFSAQVKEVTGACCSVMLDTLELTNVQLRAVINNKTDQLLIVPAKDSYVQVLDLSNGDLRQLMVISYSEIESIQLVIKDTQLEITENGISIQRQGVSLFSLLNELKDIIKTLTVSTGVGPSGTPLPSSINALNQFESNVKKLITE